ncbi:MAG: D-alanine--D-alanine ligase [Verrucomicrobia bacterium]|jgi:D-alanine-D-alanine ligase|nr:D-alanine--D-alanine ligase [Verrucomicrobiota bacterium]
MTSHPEIVVLCGGLSSEREVSLRSGRAVSSALPGSRLVELDADALPAWLDGAKHVVLPVLHGGWGEDGRAQAEMEAKGIAFAGCSSAANRLCMDKVATKAAMRAAGVPAIPEVAFAGAAKPTAAALVAALGEHIVIKPADQGSSVGLYVLAGEGDVAQALAEIPASGRWMAERRLRGREMSVGLLDGQPMGLVEIVPLAGVYDFKTKYTKGASEYRFPAPVGPELTAAIGAAAARLFAAGGCRDFARADVFLEPDGRFYFLEINTMPGMTETSLMPKSASCVGLDFPALVRRMAAPALARAAQTVRR